MYLFDKKTVFRAYMVIYNNFLYKKRGNIEQGIKRLKNNYWWKINICMIFIKTST